MGNVVGFHSVVTATTASTSSSSFICDSISGGASEASHLLFNTANSKSERVHYFIP